MESMEMESKVMQNVKRWVALGLLAAACGSALTGCTLALVGAGAAAGAGAVAYSTGELRGNLDASLDRTWSATQRAVGQFEFKVDSTQTAKDALSARMKATTANRKDIAIRLTQVSEKVTEVRIRVDTFGDEALSRSVFEKIRSNL